jgi:hypothetical protein
VAVTPDKEELTQTRRIDGSDTDVVLEPLKVKNEALVVA